MAVSKMKFVGINGPKSEIDRIIVKYIINSDIHLENAIDIMRKNHEVLLEDTSNPYEYSMNLSNSVKSGLRLKFEPSTDNLSVLSIDDAQKYIENLNKKILEHTNKIETIEEKIKENEEIIANLGPLQDVDESLEHLFTLKHIRFRFGHMSKESFNKLETYLKEPEVLTMACSIQADRVWLAVFIPQEIKGKVDETFSSLLFQRVRISDKVPFVPRDGIKIMNEEIEGYKRELSELKNAFNTEIQEHREEFIQVYNLIALHYASCDVRKYVVYTRESFYLGGWVPLENLNGFLEKIEEEKLISCIVGEPSEFKNTIPPTKLNNFSIFKPFEMFVKMYGIPSYNEIDPTMFVAITYTVMFGMMFGDVGQGLVLTLIGIFLAKKTQLGGIMISAGISSMFFGFMYGSIFGFEEVFHHIWINPMKNINYILLLTVGIGIMLIITAIVINIINAVKSKNIRALLSHNGISGLVFYTFVIGVALFYFKTGNLVMPLGFIIGIVFIPILLMFFHEPLSKLIKKQKNIFPEGIASFLIEGFFELFEILLSFITNTISFVRVGAFALNHVGMMMVVFIFAKMANDGASVAVIIIGNILVMALEGLIVGIQVLRLEFYEMFSRFFDGQGREFRNNSIKK